MPRAVHTLSRTFPSSGPAPAEARGAKAARRTMARLLATAVFGTAVVLTSAGAYAQDSREEQLTELQAEKATRLRPFQPEGLERRLDMLEGLFVTPDRRMFPFIGSAYEGGGLAVGPGYRARYAGTGSVSAHAAWSIRNYRTADVTVKLPAFANDRISVALRANWLNAPDVSFYGVGNDSTEAGKVGLEYRSATVGASTRFQATKLFAVGGGFDSIAMEQKSTDLVSAAAAPTYGRSSVFAEVDSRTAPGYTRRGGLYRLQFSDYRQMNGSAFTFRRTDAEVQRFIPILRENWIIALRALASTTSVDDNQTVPYVLMPALGGSHTLRGYSAWRFRDFNRMLFTGEYRWTAGPLVDMALFVDTGKVAPRARDLNLRNFTTTYGIGASFHTPTSTIVRIELARTPDGNSLAMSFGPSF